MPIRWLAPLPQQPPEQVQLHSWSYSYSLNLIGKDRFPTGHQFSDRPALAQVPLFQTYTWIFPGPAFFPPVIAFNIRPPYKGLPDQPPALQQQSTFPNVAIRAQVAQNPFFQSDWPLATQLPRAEQTWAWSYNLRLIGQDQLPSGDQRLELAPSQVAPDQIQLRSWQWWYNLGLVGKDRMLVGEQVWELAPSQRLPEQIQLHSWQWSYNLNLVSKDAMATGEQVSDLPPRDPREVRAWSWQYNLNLIGQDRMIVGEQSWDRPILPIPPPSPTWAWQYNPSLIAQDLLPFRQRDWPVPLAPQQPAFSWTDVLKIWLTAPVLQITITQYWDRPQLPIPPAQSWASSYQLSLIGQDRMAVGEQSTDLPPRDFARLFQTWINTTSLALVTAPPDLTKQVHIFDYPNPRGVEPDWRRGWEASFNQNLIGKDQLPFRQSDWPNPIPPALVKDWIAQTNIALLTVTPSPLPYTRSHYDLPPPAPQQAAPSWTYSYNLNLVAKDQLPIGAELYELAPAQKPPEQVQLHSWAWWYNPNLVSQDYLPFRQSDWPLTPAAQRLVDLATWIDRTKFQLIKPFAQYDWPNPIPPARDPTLATLTGRYLLELIGADQLPNRQTDWPLPQTAEYTLLRAFILPLNIGLLAPQALLPPLFMRNQDWPVPMAPIQPNRSFSVPFNLNLPPTPPPTPGPAVYNKPLLAGPGYLNVIPGEKPS